MESASTWSKKWLIGTVLVCACCIGCGVLLGAEWGKGGPEQRPAIQGRQSTPAVATDVQRASNEEEETQFLETTTDELLSLLRQNGFCINRESRDGETSYHGTNEELFAPIAIGAQGQKVEKILVTVLISPNDTETTARVAFLFDLLRSVTPDASAERMMKAFALAAETGFRITYRPTAANLQVDHLTNGLFMCVICL